MRSFDGPFAGAWHGLTAAWDGVRQLASGSRSPVYFEQSGDDPFRAARHNIELFGYLVVAVVALIGVARRLPPAYSAYTLAALALPLSYPVSPQPLMSLPRFVAVLFPLFMWLGWWLSRGPALARAGGPGGVRRPAGRSPWRGLRPGTGWRERAPGRASSTRSGRSCGWSLPRRCSVAALARRLGRRDRASRPPTRSPPRSRSTGQNIMSGRDRESLDRLRDRCTAGAGREPAAQRRAASRSARRAAGEPSLQPPTPRSRRRCEGCGRADRGWSSSPTGTAPCPTSCVARPVRAASTASSRPPSTEPRSPTLAIFAGGAGAGRSRRQGRRCTSATTSRPTTEVPATPGIDAVLVVRDGSQPPEGVAGDRSRCWSYWAPGNRVTEA